MLAAVWHNVMLAAVWHNVMLAAVWHNIMPTQFGTIMKTAALSLTNKHKLKVEITVF
jgi:hypothetical protein